MVDIGGRLKVVGNSPEYFPIIRTSVGCFLFSLLACHWARKIKSYLIAPPADNVPEFLFLPTKGKNQQIYSVFFSSAWKTTTHRAGVVEICQRCSLMKQTSAFHSFNNETTLHFYCDIWQYRNVHKMYMYGLNNNHKENLHKIQVKNKMFSTTITIKMNKEDFPSGPGAKTSSSQRRWQGF